MRRAELALQKDRTRTRILEAARRVFARKGYHGTLMEDVAREAGLSKGALYFHFSSKEDLFLSLVEEAGVQLAERVTTAIAAARGGEAKVRAALQAAVEAFAENEDLTRLVLVEWVGLSPEFEEKRFALEVALARLTQIHLEEAVAEGRIPPQDTSLVAFAWLGAIRALVVRWLHTHHPERLVDLVPALSGLLLRSVGFRPEGEP
ncbi:MAG: TetR/AcrR family transcriptional regulator [Armatimonadetes bacterium]|nr:TetR/AcrR family transcriptional regulator [Armatimonadota bacterium]MDW8153716.1 TetR/AcrR family transcriptional regulator [Armatimonadota bacterium]